MIFAEQADTRGYNEATFALTVSTGNPSSIGFVDVFSTYHGSVGTFAFADGHAEPRRWTDAVILGAGKTANFSGSSVFDYQQYGAYPSLTGNDAAWIIQHCVSPTDP